MVESFHFLCSNFPPELHPFQRIEVMAAVRNLRGDAAGAVRAIAQFRKQSVCDSTRRVKSIIVPVAATSNARTGDRLLQFLSGPGVKTS